MPCLSCQERRQKMSNVIKKFIDFWSGEKDAPITPSISYKVRDIDGTRTGSTSLFRTQANNFRTMQLVIDLIGVAAFNAVPTISIGTNANAYDNIMAAKPLTGLSSGSTHMLVQLSGIMPDFPVSTNVRLNISAAAAASTYTINATIYGFYD